MSDPDDESATVTDPVAAIAAAARSARPPGWFGGDRYRAGDSIGHGGMGEVIAARDEQIGREVAIKRIRTEAPSNRLIERFLREARIQGRLEHPAIVPVHELGRDRDGLPFFVMKKLAGTTLSDILRARPAAWTRQRLLRAFVDVCLAVEFAHVHGVLHRDLKPSNIMLGEFGEVYVLDWGVAKVIGETDIVEDLSSGEGLTGMGAAVGTAAYMAPEQARGIADLDERADVYALGRVLSEIVTAEPVPELDALCAEAMAAARDVRVATARELADRTQRYLDGDRDLALRARLAREQLDRARTALAGGESEAARRIAMEAAGRALALDPNLAEASALVGALLLQPPSAVPAEVVAALAADARSWSQGRARGALRTHPAFAIVALMLIASAAYGYLLPLAVAVALVTGFDLAIARGTWAPPPWAIALIIAPVVAVLSVIYTPALVAPTFAAIAAVHVALDPQRRGARETWLLVAILAAAVLAPIALGALGLGAPSLEVLPDGLLLRGPGLGGARTMPLFVVYVVVVLATATAIGGALRAGDLVLRKRLHMIAWHLHQLLPPS